MNTWHFFASPLFYEGYFGNFVLQWSLTIHLSVFGEAGQILWVLSGAVAGITYATGFAGEIYRTIMNWASAFFIYILTKIVDLFCWLLDLLSVLPYSQQFASSISQIIMVSVRANTFFPVAKTFFMFSFLVGFIIVFFVIKIILKTHSNDRIIITRCSEKQGRIGGGEVRRWKSGKEAHLHMQKLRFEYRPMPNCGKWECQVVVLMITSPAEFRRRAGRRWWDVREIARR